MTSQATYAARVKAYYETYLPSRVQMLPDPEKFYRTQGQAIAREVRSLEASLTTPDEPDEEFLDKVGRLGSVRKQAEEKALGDLLFSLTPEPGTEDLEPPMQPIPGVTRVE